MSRSIRIVALVGALLLPAGASGEPVDLDRAVAIALARDPRLAALAEEERALGEAARAADRILGRNPTLGVEAGTSKSAADGTVFEWAVEVEQPLEIGGQPSARRATVRAAIDRNRAEQEVRRREVREAVRSRFVRLLAARERVEILSLADRLAAAAAEAAQARFEAGELRRVERNAARLERARTARSLAAAVVANASAEAELRQILGMGAGEPLEVEGALVPRDLGAVAPPEGELLELPSPASPESLPRTIAARRAQQEAAAQLELAESSAVPDLGVGACGGVGPGAGRLGATDGWAPIGSGPALKTVGERRAPFGEYGPADVAGDDREGGSIGRTARRCGGLRPFPRSREAKPEVRLSP